MTGNVIHIDAPEVENLTAGKYGRNNFKFLGGSKNKFCVWRGFFQGFQKCIKGL